MNVRPVNSKAFLQTTGVVTIGRNEGERLQRCINTLKPLNLPIVYVDSGSTDNSVDFCRDNGVFVVELDMSIPFTAARARNEGFECLISLQPEIKYVQFIDGDCQLDSEWLEKATDFLDTHEDYAAVCGRRRELYPLASIYNMLCDIEWDTKIGDANACGGDVLIRTLSFNEVGGYRSDVIAGEEPEMCFRMRQKGWRIYRLDAEMTLHDANMYSFTQWWKRAQRAGYAYANGAWLHKESPERYNVRPVLRILLWALLLPLLILIAITQSYWFSILTVVYILHYYRLIGKGPRSPDINRIWARYIVIGKFAEFTGLVKCLIDIILVRKSEIIEYK